MTGNLQKRRGGFGKMSQNKWKNRCFVLLKTGNLCYFQVPPEWKSTGMHLRLFLVHNAFDHHLPPWPHGRLVLALSHWFLWSISLQEPL